VDLTFEEFPTIGRVHEHCMQQSAFMRAAPGAQSDAE
jgi:maleylpyruvate isomerase